MQLLIYNMGLSNDIRNIQKLLIPVDKTNNLYELKTDEYNKLLNKASKIATLSNIHSINTEAKAIMQELKLDDRRDKEN